MSTIRPTPPLGPYPQLRLCGQAGMAPTNSKIKMISRIVEIPIRSSTFNLIIIVEQSSHADRTPTGRTLFARCFHFNLAVVNISIDLHVAGRRSNIDYSLLPLTTGQSKCRSADGKCDESRRKHSLKHGIASLKINGLKLARRQRAVIADCHMASRHGKRLPAKNGRGD